MSHNNDLLYCIIIVLNYNNLLGSRYKYHLNYIWTKFELQISIRKNNAFFFLNFWVLVINTNEGSCITFSSLRHKIVHMYLKYYRNLKITTYVRPWYKISNH